MPLPDELLHHTPHPADVAAGEPRRRARDRRALRGRRVTPRRPRCAGRPGRRGRRHCRRPDHGVLPALVAQAVAGRDDPSRRGAPRRRAAGRRRAGDGCSQPRGHAPPPRARDSHAGGRRTRRRVRPAVPGGLAGRRRRARRHRAPGPGTGPCRAQLLGQARRHAAGLPRQRLAHGDLPRRRPPVAAGHPRRPRGRDGLPVLHVAVDGCGAPLFAVPLDAFARAAAASRGATTTSVRSPPPCVPTPSSSPDRGARTPWP